MFEEPVEKWFRLEGKTAVVTGAVGILGKYFCRGLSSVGADVAVIDLDEDSCQNFAKELRQEYGTNAMGVACDITSPEEVGQMVEEVVGTLGKINVLHNNAAAKSNDLTEYFTSFEDYSYREWQEMMRVNVDGMFLVAQAVGKQMLSQGQGGSIIQTASVYGVVAPDQRIYEGSEYMGVEINTPAVYATSKAAVIGLTKYLATYWAKENIRVNAITPGGVESGQNEQFQSLYSRRVPLGRMGKASEMVGALVYLASDASSYVTGQNLIVDGGLTTW